MLGPYVSRVLQYGAGYAFPAYANYKAIEQRNTQAIKEWSTYWVVLAVFMLLEIIADRLVFWLPLYYELKLAYVIALWHPQTKFALTVYGKVLAPFLQHHEPQIDRSFAELRTVAADNLGRGMHMARTHAAKGIAAAQSYIHKNMPKREALAGSPAAAAKAD